MNILIIGIALFFIAHVVPLAPRLRASLVGRLGKGAYKGAFSLVSAIGLALMVWGYSMSRAGPAAADILYWPPDWGRPVTMLLVFLAFLSFGVFLHKGRLKVWLRNPMSIAIALWAVGHLLSNGKMSSVLLFGAFLIYALTDIAVNTARGNVPAIVPNPRHDYTAVLAGTVLFAIFLLGFHPYVLNLPLV